MKTKLFWAAVVPAAALSFTAAHGANFAEPPVFASQNGVLDILMIAKPKPVEAIDFKPPGVKTAIHPVGWVYEICYRADASDNQCPKDGSTSSEFGGVRLALQRGDTLKVRLVNKLPKQDFRKVAHFWNNTKKTPTPDPEGQNLPLSPTNLHTHGLVVQARAATEHNPTWGDNIYVTLYNPDNGMPAEQMMDHGAVVTTGILDYVIHIPRNEPSGADWYHPHVHGITSDSLAMGLSGIISIGNARHYVSDNGEGFPQSQVRNLILKDMQVLAAGTIGYQQGLSTTPLKVRNGEVLDDQQDPEFCTQQPSSKSEKRLGSCPGTDNSSDDGNNYTNGAWYFPVSGVVYPKLAVDKPKGQLWSITNASASASYRLELQEDTWKYPMLMQLVSLDGVSIHIPRGTKFGDKVKLGGARATVVPCPGETPPGYSEPLCVEDVVMLPGSRTEVWVTYRDYKGNISNPPKGASATLRSVGITTGAPGVGDPWPAVNLAEVTFSGTYTDPSLVALKLAGDALKANAPQGIFFERVPYARPAPLPGNCAALPEGHHRRIFFGLVKTNNSNIFGLGYEEVDAHGEVVPGTEQAIAQFDPMNPFICLPLGAGQMPVRETWELVNLATENHNFHIHQTKFRAVSLTKGKGSPLSLKLDPKVGAGVMEDEVTLPIAVPTPASAEAISSKQNGYCTIAQWHDGTCVSPPTVVDIPFSQTGEFVYHCHILEHEDGGMMAKIQVVPAPVE